jgi:hypothetical protein
LANTPLTMKQKNFVIEFLKDFNSTQAAIRAGYSEKTAHAIGYENLQRPAIKNLIVEFEQNQLENAFISQEAIVRELSRYAFRDRNSAYPDLSPKDSVQALHLLGKHVGLFWDRPTDKKKAGYEQAMEDAIRELDARDAIERANRKTK